MDERPVTGERRCEVRIDGVFITCDELGGP